MGKIIDVSDDTFEQEVIEFSDSPVLVDFWAPWCRPCNTMAPQFESLSQKYGDKVKFVKASVDNTQKFAGKFGILSIPNFIFFEGGVKKAQHVGTFREDEFSEWLEEQTAKTTNTN